MTRNKLILLLIVGGAAGISWWLDNLVAPRLTETAQGPRHEADFFFDNFSATTMNAQGVPHYILSGEHLVHYLDDNTSEVVRPHLQFMRADKPKWTLSAEQGWMSPDGERVHLLGEVIMMREADETRPPLRIETRDLRIRKTDKYAETDEAVQLRSTNGTLDSVGMQAWLDTGRVALLSQVRGHYVIPQD
jgi:lipopolysaccharide export system protein LptC